MVWGLCLSLIAGIVRNALLFVCLQVPLCILLYRRHRSISLVLFAVIAACAFCAYGWLDTASYYRRAALFNDMVSDSSLITLRGWIANYPRHNSGTTEFALRVNADGNLVDIGIYAAAFDFNYGDSLQVRGTLLESRSKDAASVLRRTISMRSRSLAAYLRVRSTGITRLDGCNGFWVVRKVFWPVHSLLRNELASNLGSRSGLSIALVLGERENVSKAETQAFTRLGISHLFALSGLNLDMILGIVVLLLAPFRRHNLILICCALTFYMGAVGDVVSLHRAYAMALIGCLAKWLQRPLKPISLLGRALLVLLVLRPGAFHFVAFQFSFIATFAVLLCITRIKYSRTQGRLKNCVQYILISLKVSTYAQVFILPLALRYFGATSMITPITTLLFLPLVNGLLVAAGVCSIAGAISSDVGELGYRCLSAFNELFSHILIAVSSASPPPLRVEAPSLWMYGAGLALWFGAGKGLWKKLLGVVLIGGSFVFRV